MRAIASSIVEVFCDCPAEVAAARFAGRARHAEHHDPDPTPEAVAEHARRMRETFARPLGVGDLVRIDTTGPLDPDSVVTRVRALVEARDQHG